MDLGAGVYLGSVNLNLEKKDVETWIQLWIWVHR